MFKFSKHQIISPEKRSKEGSVRGVRCRAEVFQNDDVIIIWKTPHRRVKHSFPGSSIFPMAGGAYGWLSSDYSPHRLCRLWY